MSNYTIGCDLGSTNSCFAIYEGGEAKVIVNSDGQRTTQSIVAITKSGEELIGSAAARQMVTNAKNTITIGVGPAGTGKTYLTETLAEIMQVPFATADITSFSETGKTHLLSLSLATNFSYSLTGIGFAK